MSKPITEMSEAEIHAEIERLQSLRVPTERKPGQPPRAKRESKPKPNKRPSWRDELGL